MAIQMNITTEGLAKFRAALETGNLETLKTAKFYGGWSGGAVSGSVVATLDIAVNKAIESNSNVCRFVCQDKSDKTYTTYGGEVINADGVVIATFNNGGQPVATKQSKAEMMLGFEIKFEDNTAASSVINMGDTTFIFDDATETAAGIIELATEAEAKAGTDAKRAITPKTLDAVIEAHGNVVHRAGAEAITGYKSFEGGISKRDVSADVLIIPVNNLYSSLDFSDKNNKKYASVVGAIYSSGEFGAILATNRTIDGKEYHSQISVRVDKDGKAYATAPTPASDDSSTKIATTAWVKAVANKLFPLAGNWNNPITGVIAFNAISARICNRHTSGGIVINGGEGNTAGGSLYLQHKDSSSNPGGFGIYTSDGTTTKGFVGAKNGTLKWDGKNIVRSVNGVNADLAGNVALPLPFLPLAGGKMTATKAMSRNVADSFLGLHGGTGENNDGAQLYLCGADHPEMPSAFQLHARNETVDNILEGTIGGLLKWMDKYVLNNSFQMPTDGGAIMLTAGTSATGGAYFRLYGKSHTTGAVRFDLSATDGTNTKSLTGKPDGTLTWGGSEALLPAGAVFAFAANTTPSGCLICNGAAVSRTTYARLFAAIGITYGSGDGSTTFNLPNLTDKFIQGSGTAGSVKAAGLPNITGTIFLEEKGSSAVTGAFRMTSDVVSTASGSLGEDKKVDFKASYSSTIYGNSNTVQPPALTMRYYIKY